MTVEQAESDDSGTSTFFMDSSTSYKVVFEKSGYNSVTKFVSPSGYDYTQVLSSGGFSVTWRALFSDVSYSWSPSTLYVGGGNQSINFSVSCSNSSLEYFGLNLSYENGTVFSSETVYGSPSGGEVSGQFNSTGLNKVVASGFVKRNDFDEFVNQRTYWVRDATPGNYSLSVILESLSVSDELDSFATSLLSLFLVAFFSAGVSLKWGGGAGVFTAFLMFGFLVLAGWFSLNVLIILILGYAAFKFYSGVYS